MSIDITNEKDDFDGEVYIDVSGILTTQKMRKNTIHKP